MKNTITALAACLMAAVTATAQTASSGGADLEKSLGKATVSRLEALASQRRLLSRTVTNGVMVCTYVQSGRSWSVTNSLFSATGYAKPPRYSKLKLYAALVQVGKWDELKAWLQGQTVNGMNAWEAFSLAQDLSADHELFTTWVGLAKEALGVDDATVAAVLKAAEE